MSSKSRYIVSFTFFSQKGVKMFFLPPVYPRPHWIQLIASTNIEINVVYTIYRSTKTNNLTFVPISLTSCRHPSPKVRVAKLEAQGKTFCFLHRTLYGSLGSVTVTKSS
jgi:hypothetical protein